MVSFVSVVGPALRAHGYYVALNASGWIRGVAGGAEADSAWFEQLGPYVNALSQEYYAETSDGNNTLRSSGSEWYQDWDGDQALIAQTQAMGVDFLGAMHGAPGDTRAMSYGKASFLLEWNGGGGVFNYQTTDNSDPWNPAWTTDIGQPAAVKQQVGVGWMRKYSGGMALVNPSPNDSQTFDLGGTYRTESGSSVTTVTLGPTTGAILTGSN